MNERQRQVNEWETEISEGETEIASENGKECETESEIA